MPLPDDQRRIRAFGIYLITLNMGALAAPLVIGTLGEKVGWHYGFGAAGVGMIIGLATYLQGSRHLPPDVISKRNSTPKLTRPEWCKIGAIAVLLVPYVLYSMAANQAYGIMFVWADTAVNRKIFGWEMPVTWIGIFDGIITIVGVTVANRIWVALAKRRRDPSDYAKLMIGYVGIGLAFLFAAGIATMAVVPLILWISFFVILDMSFGWSETPTQSVVSREAPESVNALMMAFLKASVMISYFAAGWLGRFYEPLGASRYWALTAGQALLAAVLIFASRGWLRRRLGEIE